MQYHQPLFVVTFEDTSKSNAGNEYFIKNGAVRLLKSKTTGRANINALKQIVESKQLSPQINGKPKQLTLLLETD